MTITGKEMIEVIQAAEAGHAIQYRKRKSLFGGRWKLWGGRAFDFFHYKYEIVSSDRAMTFETDDYSHEYYY